MVGSNHLGTATSTNARLVVLTAPVFLRYPTGTNVSLGETLAFDAEVAGEPPFTFQWFHDGVSVAGGTNLALIITNAMPADSGFYWLQVMNASGAANSIAVQAFVTPPLPLAVDATNLVWTTGGDGAWDYQTADTYDGEDAARSGFTSDNGESWMQTTVTGPGQLHFWWQVSSEEFSDYLRFLIDGIEQQSISGGFGGWQEVMFEVPAGVHTLRWSYTKDGNFTSGEQDAGWVDQVQFTAFRFGDLTRRPDQSLACTLFGPPFQTVAVETSLNLLDWDFFQSVELDPVGQAEFIIPPGLADSARFFRATFTPAGLRPRR